MKLKPYPEYKDSGLPWLGEIPKHWHSAAVKRHFDIQLGKMLQGAPSGVSDSSVSYLKAQHVQWFAVRTRNLPPMWASPVDVAKYRVGEGDLLVCEGGEGGRSGLVRQLDRPSIIQNALHRVRPLADCRNEYLQYVMSAVSSIGWFDAINNKATIAHFTRDKFGALGIPLPPAAEQDAIVRFLDYFDRRINHLIRAKRRLIELLNEQKQAIIHRAVTRGLDPNVRLKPSGIDWLGDVPEHWKLRRFKFVTNISSGQIDPRQEPYRDYILVAPNHIESGTGRILLEESATEQGADSGKYMVKKDQVIYSKIRPNLRKAAIARTDCLCSADMYPISPRESELRPRYLLNLLLSAPFTKYVVDCSMRVAMPKVNREALGNCWLWYPSLAEQDAIHSQLTKLLKPADEPIIRTRCEIDLLREYRTRLIADVVTGKLDVRGVIEAGNGPSSSSGPYPGLPDEAEELDDLDPGEDAEAEEIIDTEEKDE